jgi:tetratricopeptide (TPR) repeat protein
MGKSWEGLGRLVLVAVASGCVSPSAAAQQPADVAFAEQLLSQLACGTCHGGIQVPSDIRKVAPDLTDAGMRLNPDYVMGFLQHPVRVRANIGLSRMPDFRLDERESLWAMALATFADRYFRQQEWSPAMTLYRKVLEIRPDDAATLRNLGLAQAYAGDFGEAVATLRTSIEADPRDPLTWVNLGLSLDGVGDAPGAENAYREAVAVAGDQPLAHFNLGNALLRRGDAAGAIRQYERALELQPTLTNAYLYLARAYGGMQDTAQVLRTARRWRRFAPGDPQPEQLVEELERALAGR